MDDTDTGETRRRPAMSCRVCGHWTRGKPYCSEHLLELDYYKTVAQEIGSESEYEGFLAEIVQLFNYDLGGKVTFTEIAQEAIIPNAERDFLRGVIRVLVDAGYLEEDNGRYAITDALVDDYDQLIEDRLLPINEILKSFDFSKDTLRRYISKGAPTVELRGKPLMPLGVFSRWLRNYKAEVQRTKNKELKTQVDTYKKRLQQAKRRHKMVTLAELARALGVSPSSVDLWIPLLPKASHKMVKPSGRRTRLFDLDAVAAWYQTYKSELPKKRGEAISKTFQEELTRIKEQTGMATKAELAEVLNLHPNSMHWIKHLPPDLAQRVTVVGTEVWMFDLEPVIAWYRDYRTNRDKRNRRSRKKALQRREVAYQSGLEELKQQLQMVTKEELAAALGVTEHAVAGWAKLVPENASHLATIEGREIRLFNLQATRKWYQRYQQKANLKRGRAVKERKRQLAEDIDSVEKKHGMVRRTTLAKMLGVYENSIIPWIPHLPKSSTKLITVRGARVRLFDPAEVKKWRAKHQKKTALSRSAGAKAAKQKQLDELKNKYGMVDKHELAETIQGMTTKEVSTNDILRWHRSGLLIDFERLVEFPGGKHYLYDLDDATAWFKAANKSQLFPRQFGSSFWDQVMEDVKALGIADAAKAHGVKPQTVTKKMAEYGLNAEDGLEPVSHRRESIAQAAEVLGVKPVTVHSWVVRANAPHDRVSAKFSSKERLYVDAEELRTWKENRSKGIKRRYH